MTGNTSMFAFTGYSTGCLNFFLAKTFNPGKVDTAKSSFKIKLFKALAITNTSPSLSQKTKYAKVQLDIFCSCMTEQH